MGLGVLEVVGVPVLELVVVLLDRRGVGHDLLCASFPMAGPVGLEPAQGRHCAKTATAGRSFPHSSTAAREGWGAVFGVPTYQ